jgi:hypothetical protein
VLEINKGIAVVASPRSPQVPVMHFLGIVDPVLRNVDPDSPAALAAQKKLADIQGRVRKLVEAGPDIEHARRFLDKRVDWAIGGFHLMYADAPGIERSIRSLQDLGVRFVVPTHCTGDEAVAAFGRAYGSFCVFGGVGREVVFDKNAASSLATYA